MSLANVSEDAEHDPRLVNSQVPIVAKIVTLLKQEGSNRVQIPTFAKKFPPSQLPRPGESKSFEIQFLTHDLPAANYQISFELQTPAGDVIGRVQDTLQIEENLADGELLGFENLRTHAGRGADTFVRRGNGKTLGEKPFLQALRKAGKDGQQQEHVYLRFDLSKCNVSREEFDRAVLLLSVQGGGFQGKSNIDVYGIESELTEDWAESGEDSLTWDLSPCRDGVGGQRYLGQLSFDNFKDHFKSVPDGIRFFAPALDEFIRSAPSDVITIVLIRENVSDAATRFKSKEGKPNEAPALALRKGASANN